MFYIALGVEYQGTSLHGSQAQSGIRTVQAELENGISQVAAEQIRIELASRTDAGVHATNQVISFSTNANRTVREWIAGTNRYLPKDVSVHSCVEVSSDFDPRRTCRWRRYLYVVGESNQIPALGRDWITWRHERLNTKVMNEQAQTLVGEHDFTSFRATGCQSKGPVRHVHRAEVIRAGHLVVFDIIANAFLLRMVRNIVGALIVCSEDVSPGLKHLLKLQDRTHAPPTAPPQGLYLVQIAYEQHPELSLMRLPPIMGSQCSIPTFLAEDFEAIRISHPRTD